MNKVKSRTETETDTINSHLNEAGDSSKSKENYWWIPTSQELLAKAESRVLSSLTTPYKTRAVNIGPVVGNEDCEIWTLSMNEESGNIPILLLHGFGAAIGLWSLNLDSLAADRPLYAIDHLGFGRSSRPKFSTDAESIEKEFVLAIEEWRKRMNLEKFVLAGHSFGGYISTSYALKYPSRVAHLVLLDPWGFPGKPPIETAKWWVRLLIFIMRPLNPFWPLRLAGPKGPQLLGWARKDLVLKFSDLNRNGDVRVAEYIYHCNVQTPSGETAFAYMVEGLGRAKRPMVDRISQLDPKVPVTGIRGSISVIRGINEDVWKEKRQKNGYVKIHMIEGAGHHVYADCKEEFHDIIQDIYTSLDNL